MAGWGSYFRVITGGACLVMSPQVRVLRAALWRSLSSEGVPLRCGLQTWGLLCEVCVVLCSGRGRDTVSLVTRGNSVFVAANRVLKRGQSRNDVVFRKTLCCEARPHLPDKKDKAGRKRVTCVLPHDCSQPYKHDLYRMQAPCLLHKHRKQRPQPCFKGSNRHYTSQILKC